jgi:predicted P-loop ATPase
MENSRAYNNVNIYKEGCKDQWYTRSELHEFRVATGDMIAAIAQTDEYDQSLFSYQNVLKRAYMTCSQQVQDIRTIELPYRDQSQLARWVQISTSRLGLERWSVSAIRSDLTRCHKEIVALVIYLQKHPVLSEGEDACNILPRDECIRLSCERLSRSNRLFAQCIAKAQVHNEHLEEV